MTPYILSDSHKLLGANDSQLGDARGVDYVRTRECLEVYSIQILDTYSGNHVNVYGTIATDFKPCYYYNRARNNPEKIGPNGFIKLVGPPRATPGSDIFGIYFDIMDDDSPSPNNVLNGSAWGWAPLLSDFDVVDSEVLKGPYCSIVFMYAVFSYAVEANVEFTFINNGGENCVNVYGTIHAFNTKVTIPTLLFKENKDSCVAVKPQQNIPLSRSLVVVDYYSSLKIEADLWDYDDTVIALGQVLFKPRHRGVDTASIKSKNCEIEVKVTWLTDLYF